MILQSLVQYYEALEQKGEITSPGWCTAKVSYALELSRDGQLKRIVFLKEEKEKGKKTVWEPRLIKVPQMVTRSSGLAANFLCDNSGYLLGIDNKGKPERSVECFQCAREKHLQILKNVNCTAAQAVVHFFEIWDPGSADENPLISQAFDEITAGANLIFEVENNYVQEDPQVKAAWKAYYENIEGQEEGICLVTGQKTQIARIHGNIKGVQGAQSSGAALVSFNAPSFESYGKEQSYNAPVGKYAVYAYTTALNHLLSNRNHVTVIGDTTVVYWSEDGDEVYQNIFMLASEPSSYNYKIIEGVFKNLESGEAVNVPGVMESISMSRRFFILGMVPNAARIAVRLFYQDSFGVILKNLKEHYDRMEIVRPARDKVKYLGIWQMLMETVNKRSWDKKPVSNMAGAVIRAIISGERYPDSLYQAVMGRIRMEKDDSAAGIYKITRGRVAIIKAFLLKNGTYSKEEITVALNNESRDVAYILGREFAVLEAIQEDANPGINTSIKDRYFNAACTTPASIFPILFKLKNSHIRKLSNRGKEIYYEKLLGGLQEKISGPKSGQLACPRRLTLEEQGRFILGYYHQTQKRFEKKEKEDK